MPELLKCMRYAVMSALFLATVLLFSPGSSANNISWFISPSDPYVQNWTLTTMITVDDNWDNVMSILGYRGDDLTTATGTDPQTILADGSSTPIDVIANQSNPNTLSTGGVAEFDGIANPTIALQGSGTADAPHIVIRLNKSNCPDTKFISISYKLRDIDGSADNAVTPVALQYRVGDVGNYINIPSAYVADATEGGTATKETNVVATLPHIPVGQDLVFLRILTANAVGNDEWVGIDDISIGCFAPTVAGVPVAGRVSAGKSEGVQRAVVTLTDDFGSIWTARTNAFGYFRFDGIPVGRTYTVSISAKGAQFAPRLVTVDTEIQGLELVLD